MGKIWSWKSGLSINRFCFYWAWQIWSQLDVCVIGRSLQSATEWRSSPVKLSLLLKFGLSSTLCTTQRKLNCICVSSHSRLHFFYCLVFELYLYRFVSADNPAFAGKSIRIFSLPETEEYAVKVPQQTPSQTPKDSKKEGDQDLKTDNGLVSSAKGVSTAATPSKRSFDSVTPTAQSAKGGSRAPSPSPRIKLRKRWRRFFRHCRCWLWSNHSTSVRCFDSSRFDSLAAWNPQKWMVAYCFSTCEVEKFRNVLKILDMFLTLFVVYFLFILFAICLNLLNRICIKYWYYVTELCCR